MMENEPKQSLEEKKDFPWQIVIWAGLIALLAIVGVSLVRAQQGSVGPGETAPAFSLTTFDGQVIDSADLAGKVVALNFWASWCIPCEQEAADLEAAWQMYQERGDVLFLGINYVDTETAAHSYLEKFAITYPNGPDLRTRISQAYRMQGVPETYFIGRDGILAYVKIGPFRNLAEIVSIIEPLIAEP
jgi:cytochrome c biogenesis protein CcmG/thiol:disulfide interchange protein DsbE